MRRERELKEKESDLRERAAKLAERETASAAQQRVHGGDKERLQAMETSMEQRQASTDAYKTRAQQLFVDSLKELSVLRRSLAEQRLIRDRFEVGRVISRQQGMQMTEIWEDGEAFHRLRREKQQLKQDEEALRVRKHAIKSSRRTSTASSSSSSSTPPPSSSSSSTTSSMPAPDGFESADTSDAAVAAERHMQDDILKLRSLELRRVVGEIKAKEEDLEFRKKALIRFQRLMRDQGQSRFNNNTILHNRYLLLDMLGKGGFSEVYRAFDLIELRYVACKIHQLNSTWNDNRKRDYTRHATREYEIHKEMDHPRVVHLFDVFSIDVNSFCTVLDYCNGPDLDMFLKEKQTLNEKTARSSKWSRAWKKHIRFVVHCNHTAL
jgi:tousled-like kinase